MQNYSYSDNSRFFFDPHNRRIILIERWHTCFKKDFWVHVDSQCFVNRAILLQCKRCAADLAWALIFHESSRKPHLPVDHAESILFSLCKQSAELTANSFFVKLHYNWENECWWIWSFGWGLFGHDCSCRFVSPGSVASASQFPTPFSISLSVFISI